MTTSKQALKDELIGVLADVLAGMEQAHQAAIEGATHAEAKPENDKDTRALEQSYLARGQAARIEELRNGLAEVTALALRTFRAGDPIALSALVTADEADEVRRFFVAPHGGGSTLAGGTVYVVTPRSPLGQALVGRRVDDDCELRLPGKTRALTITGVE